jgi:hypothetical protein
VGEDGWEGGDTNKYTHVSKFKNDKRRKEKQNKKSIEKKQDQTLGCHKICKSQEKMHKLKMKEWKKIYQ